MFDGSRRVCWSGKITDQLISAVDKNLSFPSDGNADVCQRLGGRSD